MGASLSIERLLEQATWLRQLAAELVNDSARADDLVQETWVAALRSPPPGDVAPRRWLARVARNLASNSRRAELRRAEHEDAAGERGGESSPEARAQALEAQRLLTEAVGALDEPLRAVVVLRYFQGLDSAAIGRELGLSESAVRTRMQRALEELRTALDRRFGGERKAWSAVLATLVPRGAELAPLTVAGAGGSTLGWLAAAGVVLVLVTVGAVTWKRAAASGDVQSVVSANTPAEPVSDEVDALEAPLQPPTRIALATDAAQGATAPAVPEAPDRLDLAGTILVDGRPAEWPVELELRPPDGVDWQSPEWSEWMRERDSSLTTSFSAPGVFRFDALPATWRGRIAARNLSFEQSDDGGESLALAAPASDLVLRLRSGAAVFGRFVDERGAPVGHARFVYERRCGYENGTGESQRDELESRADGRFRVPIPAHGRNASATLLVESDGLAYRSLETPVFAPEAGLDLGDVVVEPVRALAFRVLAPDGHPLVGALARVEGPDWSRRSEATDADGKGVLPFAPERGCDVRFSAFRHADRVVRVAPDEVPDITLERLSALEIQLVRPPGDVEPLGRLVLESRESLFACDPYEPPGQLQIELGATPTCETHGKVDAPGIFHAEFLPRAEGTYCIVGLRPGISLQIEVRGKDERVLAARTTSLAPGEWARLELPLGP